MSVLGPVSGIDSKETFTLLSLERFQRFPGQQIALKLVNSLGQHRLHIGNESDIRFEEDETKITPEVEWTHRTICCGDDAFDGSENYTIRCKKSVLELTKEALAVIKN